MAPFTMSAAEVRLRQRPPGQLPPEGEEGLGEVDARLVVLQQERHVRLIAELLLGEVAHRQRQSPLAAVVPVQRAHRDAQGLGQRGSLHILIAAPRQQSRRGAHGIGVHHFHKPHAPSPPRRLGDWLPRTRRPCASPPAPLGGGDSVE